MVHTDSHLRFVLCCLDALLETMVQDLRVGETYIKAVFQFAQQQMHAPNYVVLQKLFRQPTK